VTDVQSPPRTRPSARRVVTVRPAPGPHRIAARDGDGFAVTRDSSVTHVHLLSLAKVALVFWTCVAALAAGVFVVAYLVLTGAGAIDRAESFVADMTGLEDFRVVSGTVLAGVVLLLVVLDVVAVTLTVLAAAFYNALARLVGGVEVRTTEHVVGALAPPAQQGDGARSNGHAEVARVS
jgi:hypothetical protein